MKAFLKGLGIIVALAVASITLSITTPQVGIWVGLILSIVPLFALIKPLPKGKMPRINGGLMALLIAAIVFSADTSFAEQLCRRDWFSGGNWNQVDRMNTRHRILQTRGGENVVVDRSKATDQVTLGTWTDEFTVVVYENVDPSGLLEIDHLIPLQWACRYGAPNWTEELRDEFYNDEVCLLVVHVDVNRRKQDDGAEDFVPPDDRLACEYVSQFQECLNRYPFENIETVRERLASHNRVVCR
jgi:hypothetical protein